MVLKIRLRKKSKKVFAELYCYILKNYHPPQQQTLSNLQEYALQRISEDRAKFNLLPVKLIKNDAAQVHAEDILKTEQKYHTG